MRSPLILCPSCHRACDECGQPLRVLAFCPPCAGRRGGSSRSTKKSEASRANLARTRRIRAKRRTERKERGQVIRV